MPRSQHQNTNMNQCNVLPQEVSNSIMLDYKKSNLADTQVKDFKNTDS